MSETERERIEDLLSKLGAMSVRQGLTAEFDRLIAERDAARADDWQPIETAPTEIKILLCDEYGDMAVAHSYIDENRHTQWTDGYRSSAVAIPAHWRPLPASPTTSR